jgi:hypothetical protein
MVVTYFVGNNKCENYEEIVEFLVEHYEVVGRRMSVKLHSLHSQLELFRPNLGDVSQGHGEGFHQVMAAIEKRHPERWDAAVKGDHTC